MSTKNALRGLRDNCTIPVLLKRGIIIFLFFLPIQTRYFFREASLYEYGTLSVFFTEVIGWIIIALGLLQYGKIKQLLRRKLNLLFLLLPALALLSIVWAPDKAVALQAAVRLLEGVLLFFVLRSASYILLPTMVYAFLAGAVLQAGLGIYQFLAQSSFAASWLGMALHSPQALGTAVVEFGGERWLRAYGGLPHPNVLGGYLAIALAIGYRIRRLLLQVAMPILLTGIFFSFSRAAWIAGIGLLSYWFIGLLKRRAARQDTIYVLLTTFYILFLVLAFRPLVATRIFSGSDERLEVKSRAERIAGVSESWNMVKKHPLLGVGIGNYTQGVRRDVRQGDPLYTYQPVHNVPLLILAELGAIGLILLIGILYFLWHQSQNYLLLTTFYILLIFDHYLWSLPFGILLFWAILGLFAYHPQGSLDKKTLL